MKHMRKALALVLALIMVLGLAVSAYAEEGETPVDEVEKISISVVTSADGATVEGHTYNVYQIFTGTVAEDGKTLSDIEIGENIPEGKTVADVQAIIDAASGAEAVAKALKAIVTGNPVEVLDDENGHAAEVVPGYYLIVDVSEELPEGETSSAFILQVLEAVEIKSKHTAGPTTEKKIDDTNDSVDATDEINWQDSADHDIGDKILFKLEMTVPAVFNQFVKYNEAYKFVFHDKEEAGLTFQNDAKVYVDGQEVTSGFEVKYPADDGDTFDVVFADLTKVAGVTAGSKITVEYHSVLNENAVLGNKGNVNEMYGEYSNLHRPEYPGFTPKDTVIAFTYKVVVNKIDKDKNPLPGATFTLEKYIAATGEWIAIEKVDAESDTVFTFKGLDDGNYRLTETEAPDGYNKIDPIEFTVTAEHDITWETEKREDLLISLTGDVTTGEIEFTAIDEEGNKNVGLSSDVINQAGVVLPETGGIGTTIFYILGGLLAVAAVVLLVTKKRMASAE